MEKIDNGKPIPKPRTEQIGSYPVSFEMITMRHEAIITRGNMRGVAEGWSATLFGTLQMPEGGGPALVELVRAESPYSELEAALELVEKIRGTL